MKSIMLFVVLSVGFVVVGCDSKDDAASVSSRYDHLSSGSYSNYASTYEPRHYPKDYSEDRHGTTSSVDTVLDTIFSPLTAIMLVLATIVLMVRLANGVIGRVVEWFGELRALVYRTRYNTDGLREEHQRTLDRLIEAQAVDFLSSGRIDAFNRSLGRGGLDLEDVDLSNLDLTGVSARDLTAEGISVAGSKLDNSVMGCHWADADAKDASFRDSKIHGEFVRCNFEGCDFTSADLTDVWFTNCRLVGTKIEDAKMDEKRLGDLITEKVRQEAEERRVAKVS